MNDLEYHQLSQAAANLAYEQAATPEQREHFLRLKAEAAQRVKRSAFRPPLVFILSMPPFVTLGEEGSERTLLHPGLAGLEYAWRIFLGGVQACGIVNAADLLESQSKRPGNALRNAIAAAADWIEKEARCPELAMALRPPALSITDAGEVRLNPARLPPIRLGF